MKHIVFDCETQKLFQEIKDRSKVWDLKMSTTVTYCYEEDMYRFWTYTVQNDLLEYLNGNFVIGFNSIGFDSPLLLGEKYVVDDNTLVSTNGKYSWTNYDILVEIRKRLYGTVGKPLSTLQEAMRKNFSLNQKGVYSLDNICIATLNHHKNGHGEDAVSLFRAKKILELVNYNLQDVRLTKQLYDFIRKYKYVVNGNFDICKFE